MASGADLVYPGARLLATTESPAPDTDKQMVVDHGAGDAPQQRWRDMWAAGQGLSTIREDSPVADVVDRLARERELDAAAARCARLAGARAGVTPPGP